MIREPIYETVDDARRGKVSQTITTKVVKLKPGKTLTRKVTLTKVGREKATEKAKQMLARLTQEITTSG